MLLDALSNKPSPARDIVAFNAGASLYLAGLASSLGQGVTAALMIIQSGAARKKVDQLVAYTQSASH